MKPTVTLIYIFLGGKIPALFTEPFLVAQTHINRDCKVNIVRRFKLYDQADLGPSGIPEDSCELPGMLILDADASAISLRFRSSITW